MTQLEEIAESGSPLTAQRLSGKIVAGSGSLHSTEAPLEEGCGTGSPHSSETRLKRVVESGSHTTAQGLSWKKVAGLAHTQQQETVGLPDHK